MIYTPLSDETAVAFYNRHDLNDLGVNSCNVSLISVQVIRLITEKKPSRSLVSRSDFWQRPLFLAVLTRLLPVDIFQESPVTWFGLVKELLGRLTEYYYCNVKVTPAFAAQTQYFFFNNMM